MVSGVIYISPLQKALGRLANKGRLTDSEFQELKRLCPFKIQGWEWDDRVEMWKSRDSGDVAALQRIKSLLDALPNPYVGYPLEVAARIQDIRNEVAEALVYCHERPPYA